MLGLHQARQPIARPDDRRSRARCSHAAAGVPPGRTKLRSGCEPFVPAVDFPFESLGLGRGDPKRLVLGPVIGRRDAQVGPDVEQVVLNRAEQFQVDVDTGDRRVRARSSIRRRRRRRSTAGGAFRHAGTVAQAGLAGSPDLV